MVTKTSKTPGHLRPPIRPGKIPGRPMEAMQTADGSIPQPAPPPAPAPQGGPGS